MKIIRRIEIATILVVALNLIFEFLFHISIKIIPKFFIVSLCTVVLFLTSVVSVFLHLSKNKSKIFKYSCKAIISLFLSLILLINVPFNYKTERLRFTHSDYEIVISRYYVMTSFFILAISFILINSGSTYLDNSSLLYLELAG